MNTLSLIGRIGKDAEVKELNGQKVINFSLAWSEKKDSETIWFDCAKWGDKVGVADYLKKGTQVAITGKVGLRKREGGAALTVNVNSLTLLGSKAEGEAPAQQQAAAPQPKAKAQPVADDLSLPF